MADATPGEQASPTRSVEGWDDADLVVGILARDFVCFDALYARYCGRIYGFALNRLRDPLEAEDVTQEVFLQVYRSLSSYQGRSSLLTWMFGIAHNQLCRRFRKQAPQTISIDDLDAKDLRAPSCSPERRFEAARILHRCSECVERELTSSQQDVFYLKYRERRSTRSIADQLGKSCQAVKISLFRSRQTLARHKPDLDEVLAR